MGLLTAPRSSTRSGTFPRGTGSASMVTCLYSSNNSALCIYQAIGPASPALASLKSSTSIAWLRGGRATAIREVL